MVMVYENRHTHFRSSQVHHLQVLRCLKTSKGLVQRNIQTLKYMQYYSSNFAKKQVFFMKYFFIFTQMPRRYWFYIKNIPKFIFVCKIPFRDTILVTNRVVDVEYPNHGFKLPHFFDPHSRITWTMNACWWVDDRNCAI